MQIRQPTCSGSIELAAVSIPSKHLRIKGLTFLSIFAYSVKTSFDFEINLPSASL